MLVKREAGGPSALPISIRPIHGEFKLRAYDQSGVHIGVSTEDDGTLRHQLVAWETDAPAAQVRVRAETDGTLRMQLIGSDDQGTTQRYIDTEATGELRCSNVGWNGSAITRYLLETTGEQKVVAHGKDSAGNIDPFRTNDNMQAQVEIVGLSSGHVQIDPQLIPVAEADLWDPGGDAADVYDVEFLVVNIDGTNSAWASVGQDVAGGGGLTVAEYFMYQEIIPAKASSGWRGPFRIGGDDHIRGVAQAANDLTIHFRAQKVVEA